jgi:lipoyl(octanoyl) transferase
MDLGLAPYRECVELQRETLESVSRGAEDVLILVEHHPVITLGANFHVENLLKPVEELEQRGISVDRTERGGDVTYHGPGQLVAYPIFDLHRRGRDLHRWLRDLEGAVISTLRAFDLDGRRFPPHTGVWIEDRKICAMGIKVRRWTSMHGLALNCNTDLCPFSLIVPCGIRGYGVTSISKELDRSVTLCEVKPHLVRSFEELVRS